MTAKCGILGTYLRAGTGNGWRCPQFWRNFAFGWHFSGSWGREEGKLEPIGRAWANGRGWILMQEAAAKECVPNRDGYQALYPRWVQRCTRWELIAYKLPPVDTRPLLLHVRLCSAYLQKAMDDATCANHCLT
ncbi:uncharacterized protein TRIVIDRAFT_197407 [Trichoderma virens Gv29-8]|uniref:Uncharacterized protein n=1 Tax=Hypocrea virens (strain Gv29-8 / FGSC 10586) TaxID=413071 RepID=G9MGZ1_HYPVG|nr:uncharacterized protein TRIVIDRAFT_197407 [Trichoderma virens Gv29-8]EHK25984.1 hypothetical protein TRIVIDRAFT_197407 [Trichoderma virens Gv29-8]